MTVFGAPAVLDFLDYGFGGVGIGYVGGDPGGFGGRGGGWGFIDPLRDGVDVGLPACGADYPGSGSSCCEGKGRSAADASCGARDKDGLSLQAVDRAVKVDIGISGVPGCGA